MPKPRILIIGVGRLGEALMKVIAPAQFAELALYDVDTTKMPHSYPMHKLAQEADFVFLSTPSTAVRDVLQEIGSVVPAGGTIVSFVKGLDPATGATMHECLHDMLPAQKAYAILGGPMLSAEIAVGRTAAATAGTTPATFAKLSALFAPTIIKLEFSADPQGVALAGVLKNIYALGLGMAAALELGDNATGWLVQTSLREMRELLPRLGGQAATAESLAGVGDLVATGCSVHSRNRTVGKDLVTHGTTPIPSEGLLSLPLLMARPEMADIELPWLTVIKEIVLNKKDARQTFAAYREGAR